MEIHGRGDGVEEDHLGDKGVWRSMGGGMGWGKTILVVRECGDLWEGPGNEARSSLGWDKR